MQKARHVNRYCTMQQIANWRVAWQRSTTTAICRCRSVFIYRSSRITHHESVAGDRPARLNVEQMQRRLAGGK
jgi:hypothetical protein